MPSDDDSDEKNNQQTLKRSRPEDDTLDTTTTTKRTKPKKPLFLEHIPLTRHYHVSWMHAHVITSVVACKKHGYVVSASADGVVKFWKRVAVVKEEENTNSNKKTKQKNDACCLEFAKSFTAHAGAVATMALDRAGDVLVSVGQGMLKFYNVRAFDVSHFVQTNKPLGSTACWINDTDNDTLAVSSSENGSIFLFSTRSGECLQTLTFHGASIVTCLIAHPTYPCVLSTDQNGILELWDTSGAGGECGGPLTKNKHGIVYTSKHQDTDLYTLLKKKTFCVAVAVSYTHYALYGADGKVRILEHKTGKILVTLDERLKVYEQGLYTNFGLDAMEYGQRAAVERELVQESSLLKGTGGPLSICFDPSGRYLLIPTMMGIKCLDWQKRRLKGVIGSEDASQMRLVGCCLAWGDANVSQQLQLARGGTTLSRSEALENKNDDDSATPLNDSLLIALAYNKRRIYVYSHAGDLQPPKDMWNEAPTADDAMYHPQQQQRSNAESGGATRAILRTTMGDIHMELFATQVPKTIENFVGHAKAGYYDNVIFHRIIKSFMLQTGDPLGDGTGGESIWGGEFEDEFVPSLRHDRPFTVSMANAGPNTNGSQFFITTVPTPWLDNKHTVFGRVVKGMDVCTLIENVKTDDLDKPLEEISIQNVDIL